MPRKKSRITKFFKRYEWATTYAGLILTLVLALWNYYNPAVVIQKETVYRTIHSGTFTQTMTVITTATATVTRANGTVEDLTKQ